MDQLDLAARLVGYANRSRYVFRGNFLFDGIPLNGAHVLEVGCGTGAWAIWGALHGASRVLGIEPQDAGSSENSLSLLRQNIEELRLNDRVEAQSYCLQDLPDFGGLFDVIVMYNVVNHLDEDAVQILHKERNAFERYVSLLRK